MKTYLITFYSPIYDNIIITLELIAKNKREVIKKYQKIISVNNNYSILIYKP